VHKLLDLLVLGKKLGYVHRFKDAPYKVLGRKHRVLFHDHATNLMLGLLFGREAFISGELHDLLDGVESWLKRQQKLRERRLTRS